MAAHLRTIGNDENQKRKTLMEHVELEGVVVPVLTPVDDEDRVDEPAFRRILRRLIGSGVHNLFVGGSAGEGPLLMAREWQRMIEIAVDEVKAALPLFGGAIDTSTRRVLDKLSLMASAGYQYAVVTPTYYYSLQTPTEHLRLFGACAETAPGMTLIAYNIPGSVHSQIPVKVLADLAGRGLVKYCKESSGDLDYFGQVVAETTPLGMRVFMGDEASIADGLRLGACGVVPVCANFEPQTYIDAYQAGKRQDWAELARLHQRIMDLRANLPRAAPCWVAGVKYAVATLGIGSGMPVSPLEPLTAEERQKLEAFVRAAK